MMQFCAAGDFAAASDEAAALLKSAEGGGDEVMWRLEAGMLALLNSRWEESIAHFDRAEALMEDFDQRAVLSLRQVGAEGGVLLTNMNVLPYRGWCRDRIMLPVLRALAYLGKDDAEGFRTELFRLRGNQQKIMDDYREMFRREEQALRREKRRNREAAANADPGKILSAPQNAALRRNLRGRGKNARRGGAEADLLNPLALYLSGYGYCRDRDWENALVDFDRLRRLCPDNPLIRRSRMTAAALAGRGRDTDEETAETAESAAMRKVVPGQGTLLVIFAKGRGAAFREGTLYLPLVLPRYASLVAVAWPECEYYDRPDGALKLSWREGAAETVPLVDMDDSLVREYRMRLPGMIARIALGTAVKEAASYALVRSAGEVNDLAGAAAMVGTSFYKAAVNTADTRCWETLPGEFQAVEIPMPSDGRLAMCFGALPPVTVSVPEEAASALLWVYAPGNGVLHQQLMVLEKKQ